MTNLSEIDIVVLKRKETMNIKEYLNEKYELITAPESEAKEPHAKGWIEVPRGADFYAEDSNLGVKGNYFFRLRSDCFNDEAIWLSGNWMRAAFNVQNMHVFWQRNAPAVPDEVNKSSKLKSVSETLKERQQQYGCFEDVAHVTQGILKVLRSTGGYDRMPPPHKESLHMIASKMARIVNGDFNYKDNWHNIAGYAKLIEELIGGIGDTEDDIPF